MYDRVKKAHLSLKRGDEVSIEKPSPNTRVVYANAKFIASYDLNDGSERSLYSQRYVNAL